MRPSASCYGFILLGSFLLSLSGPCTGHAQESAEHNAEAKALRQAIGCLIETFGDRYPDGQVFLNQLARMERTWQNTPEQMQQFNDLRTRALIAHPRLTETPILFVMRKQYRADHHNTATLFQTGEINTQSFTGGSAIKVFDPAAGSVKTLLELPDGVVRDLEVNFDGDRILFAMRKDIRDNYHIYDMATDGTGLRQLTCARDVTDIDPLYLPDGHIAFSSTREPKFCMCNRHIMANLFRMEPDGANIHQIGKSTLFEGHGSLLPDGRILYYRWEYIDRNFGDAQGLWTVNPDGTNHAVYWGNNTFSPGGVIDARAIPGTENVICTFTSCHDRPWGALAIIDRRLGLDGPDPVLKTWPADAKRLMARQGNQAYGFDNFSQVRLKYEDPYPLDASFFLCSRMTGRGEQMGMYLVDVFGNEICLHVEADGCFDPMPLGSRPTPATRPTQRNFEGGTGAVYVFDVYEGTHMQGVTRGTVKTLRVVESPEKRFWVPSAQWGGQGQENPAMAWHDFNNKRILGTVPVEADGSVYFEMPSDTWVYFQLLDDKGMMVQSMRSGTIVQSGEVLGCVGCHENRQQAPGATGTRIPLAMQAKPKPLQDWYGPPRLFDYMAEVQPVFDKHCVSCHDYGQEAGKTLILAGDRTHTFNASYNELWRKKYIQAVGAGPETFLSAYTWGSHASKLVKAILAKKCDVQLDPESFDRLVTWIDINGPYYGTYASAYPYNLSGRSPLNNEQVNRLSELTGVPFFKLASHGANRGPQVSFSRPELSPCLSGFSDKNDARYSEALAIITAGADMLRTKPRADMPNFVPWETDQKRQAKYLRRQQIELENRQAILDNRKLYDTP
ncbi:MAG: hypothetical protein K9N55_02650 [Phycisphaerae bacterium]|nr:hypothetical protein [Phycisphaerae bacterium]